MNLPITGLSGKHAKRFEWKAKHEEWKLMGNTILGIQMRGEEAKKKMDGEIQRVIVAKPSD